MASVGDSVRKAIDDWSLGDLDFAMLHACNAVDGTAKKVFPSMGSNARFTRLLRESYGILGPMGMPSIDILKTRWPVSVANPKAPGGRPDLADVIYGIHRCAHGHGEELPDGFTLLSDAAGPDRLTHIEIERGKVRLSDRMIFALIGVAVFSSANFDQRTPDGYLLTFAGSELPINQWWGRSKDFLALVAKEPVPNVFIDFNSWFDKPA